MISDTKDGVLIVGRSSFSIDHQRYNFQFTGGSFFEIKNGRITTRLRDLAYQSNSLDFWRGCDGIGGKDGWEMHGTFLRWKRRASAVQRLLPRLHTGTLSRREHHQYRGSGKS